MKQKMFSMLLMAFLCFFFLYVEEEGERESYFDYTSGPFFFEDYVNDMSIFAGGAFFFEDVEDEDVVQEA